jgi:ketosteroid isomerase-like protein
MSEREQNRELTARAIGAFKRGDVEAVNAALDPEIEVKIADDLANAGTWNGIDGFWKSISSWLEAFDDDYNLDVQAIETPDDHHVIVEAHQTARGRLSGVPVELTTYFLFEVRDGISTRFEIHASRDAAMAAVRPQ